MGHTVMTGTTENPSRQFGWRARRSWRRTARRIVADHREDLLLRVAGFRGLSSVSAMLANRMIAPSATRRSLFT
jgi:hypothetical protein